MFAALLFGSLRSLRFRGRLRADRRAGDRHLVAYMRGKVDATRDPDDFHGLRTRTFDARELERIRFITFLQTAGHAMAAAGRFLLTFLCSGAGRCTKTDAHGDRDDKCSNGFHAWLLPLAVPIRINAMQFYVIVTVVMFRAVPGPCHHHHDHDSNQGSRSNRIAPPLDDASSVARAEPVSEAISSRDRPTTSPTVNSHTAR